MKTALQEAQTEKQVADIALMEATARAEVASDAATRLESAVAALEGTKVPSPPTAACESKADIIIDSNDERRNLSYEEFEADRKVRQRQAKRDAKKAAEANNPYAHLKCNGCGRTGSLQDTVMRAPSGATVRMMVCSGCNNQIMS